MVDRGIDFFQFEIALELVSEKKGVSKSDVRSAMIQQGVPKATASNQVVRMVRPKDNARLMSEKRIAAILRRSPRELQSERSVDNSELWRVFGLNSKAGRVLKRVYTTPLTDSPQCTPRTTRSPRGLKTSPRSNVDTSPGPLMGSKLHIE